MDVSARIKEKAGQSVEHIAIKATALSPIHVGSYQQALEKTEYIATPGQVWVADSAAVFGTIITDSDVSDWLNGKRTSLTKLYQRRKAENKPLPNLSNLALYSVNSKTNLDGDSQYRPFARNGYKRPYLAGSSIKGALRNAWLFHYLNPETQPDALRQVADKVNQIIADYKKNNRGNLKAAIDAALDESFFRAGYVPEARRDKRNIQGDVFRMLRVSDSDVFSDDRLAAEDIRVVCDRLNYRYDNRGNLVLREKTSLVAECIQERTSLNFNLNFNLVLREHYQGAANEVPGSLIDWLDKADEFFRQVWDYEVNFFIGEPDKTTRLNPNQRDTVAPNVANFYRTRRPPEGKGWLIRVGAGSGLHSVTPGLALRSGSDEEDEWLLDEEDRSLFRQIGFFGFWREENKAETFPKSRKVIYRNNDYQLPLGWLWLEKVEGEG